MKPNENNERDSYPQRAAVSSLDLERIQDLLNSRQYDGVLFMLERYQHSALEELRHRATVKSTADVFNIDTLQLAPEHTAVLIGMVRKKYKIERNLNAGAKLIIFAAFVVFLIGFVWLAYRNTCGLPLLCIFPTGFILNKLYSIVLPKL